MEFGKQKISCQDSCLSGDKLPGVMFPATTSWMMSCTAEQGAEYGEANRSIAETDRRIADIVEDGILCSILSMLKTRDAVRTSVLSSRWRNLWKHIPNLKFSSHTLFEVYPFDLKMSNLSLEETREKFIRCVNEFLHHHRGVGVKAMSVVFPLHNKHAQYLDQWLSFAVNSGAKKLAFLLDGQRANISSNEVPYIFPCHVFTGERGCSIEHLHLAYCSLSPGADYIGFSSLKILCLYKMNIGDKDIDIILSICPVIECLSISGCQELVNLCVSHHSARMKSLHVRCCYRLRKIEFDSITLTSFGYFGTCVRLISKNKSRVLKASVIMTEDDYAMDYALTELSGNLSHIESLHLFAEGPIEVMRMLNSCKFTHLKHIALGAKITSKDDALGLSLFLNAAPLLEKFHLHLRTRWVSYGILEDEWPLEQAHRNLKQFKITGFCAMEDDIELVLYVVRNAIALEKLIIDPYMHYYELSFQWEKLEFLLKDAEQPFQWEKLEFLLKDADDIRRKANQYLCGRFRSTVELIIL